MARGSPAFEPTLWSQVLLAAREPDSDRGRRAVARLCEMYWYPVYASLRRRGYPPPDAEDITQGFFQHVLSNGFFSRARPDFGRFRSFLLGAVGHYCANERERNAAQRRGGAVEKVSMDALAAEGWLAADPSKTGDAAAAFDRAWATALINHAIMLLEKEQAEAGKAAAFALLKIFLQRAARPGEYERIGSDLKMSRGAVAAAVHRLQNRFVELVRKLVRDTVVDPEMADGEMRSLGLALRS